MLYQRGPLWWIESAGGPLLLLSNQYLSAWLGHAPAWEAEMDPDASSIFDDQGPSKVMTDYERAGMIDGYIGVIEVKGGQGVVLSGDWLATAWLSIDEREGIFIRWIHGVDQAGLIHRLAPIPPNDWSVSVDAFHVGPETLSLFDSAWPGAEAPERLTITLMEGDYTIETALTLPDEHTKLVVHRLRLQ